MPENRCFIVEECLHPQITRQLTLLLFAAALVKARGELMFIGTNKFKLVFFLCLLVMYVCVLSDTETPALS